MNWKIFITSCISSLLATFPQNIIGCGPEQDPFNYYISFFHQNLPEVKAYQPFYYSSEIFLYDDKEPVELSDLLAIEWAKYCSNGVTETDAKLFVNKFAYKDIEQLNTAIDKSNHPGIPDSVINNSMSKYFAASKNNDALTYIIYAKKVEPFVTGNADSWQPLVRDSAKMNDLINTGVQLYYTTMDNFLKVKYGYQITRLALYSKNYKSAAEYYDKLVAINTTQTVLKPMALSLKAGAENGLGNKREAAYLYSKVFNETVAKRISNYISFRWMVDFKADRNEYLKICKNNKEKAGMLALFAFGSTENELPAIKNIYNLDVNNEQLEVLLVREINKMEEKYLSPHLQKDRGRRQSMFYSGYPSSDSSMDLAAKEMRQLVQFLGSTAKNNKYKNTGLFKTAAAYVSYLMNDLPAANNFVTDAEKMTISIKLKDQLMLTKILIAINGQEIIDRSFEDKILPSIKWLGDKVVEESKSAVKNNPLSQWAASYSNLMNDILAPRYHKQGNLVKETLTIGAADFLNNNGTSQNAIQFMQNNLSPKEATTLYTLMVNKNPTPFDAYILTKNSIKKNILIEFIGTAFLREYDFKNALLWLNSISTKKQLVINTNPFADMMQDQQDKLPNETTYTTSKIVFAREMQKQFLLSKTDKLNAAKHLYKVATGMYNMTYYGHAWLLVQYYRSTNEGYYIPADATNFEKEYFGCFTALNYYKKAMDAGTEKNFKAKCLFMMAKCSQKQIQQPQYFMFTNDYSSYDKLSKAYIPRFINNIYFPQLIKEYGTTSFYKEAYKSCSYLRDFTGTK